MTRIETTVLGGSLKIPRMITGLWQLAGGHDVDLQLDECAKEMSPLVDAGLTTFDMADHYGPAEQVIGRYHSITKSPIQAFTKWCPTDPHDNTFETTEAAVDLALERMGQTRIDLLQYHAWDYSNPQYLTHLIHLQSLQSRGKILHIGLTNTDLPHLKLLKHSNIHIISNQVSTSVIDRRIVTRGIGKWCAENGVGILSYGTLLGGFLSEKWVDVPEPGEEELGNWSLKKYKRFIDAAGKHAYAIARPTGGWQPFQTVLQTLSKIALKHSVPISAVATRHVLDLPGVSAVMIGSRLSPSTLSYIPLNLQAFSLILDQEDVAAIAKAQEGLKDIPGENGDEYRRKPFLTASGDLSDHLGEDGKREREEVQRVVKEGGRVECSSGSPWEPIAGYCRGLRIGNTVRISGTTSSILPSGIPIGGSSLSSQSVHIFDIATRALNKLGSSVRDVTRTRIMVDDISNGEDVEALCKEHGWVMGREGIRPANTFVGGTQIFGKGLRVEIEFEAVVGGSEEVLRI